MITSVLVANRGEIACRIFRTCGELGIRTVAVYSDADANALHTRVADAAVRLPGAAPSATYLDGDLIVKAAIASGADAVHPGYGFLSENADFARAVLDAGLVWIGPPPEAIEAMASKTRAKELMGLAPLGEVTEADLPVLVKAAAGGGGRGMRIVRRLQDLSAALESARSEAASAFGDGEVFVEPYVENGRHVEVQILADTHGTVWPLGTRDCSLQRRHQKVIEESPAPGLSEQLTDELLTLAVRAARAVDYVGAGTVEFLVAGDKAHFLEMNTRLQVEHPVTEAVFGIDLVAEQLRVAEGHALPDAPPHARGHAVEARLYAEDPAHDWAPQTGTLHRFAVPAGVRLDTGFTDGDEIGVHYDPMLAKLVAHAPTRAAALRKLAGALERSTIHGPLTNRDLLVRSLRHEEFTTARMDTGFYDRHLTDLTEPAPDPYAPWPRPSPTPTAAPASAASATCRLSRRASLTRRPARGSRSTIATPARVWRRTGCASYMPVPPWSYSKWTAYDGTSRSPGTATRSTSTPPASPRCPASPTRRPSTHRAPSWPPCRGRWSASPTA